MSQSEVDSCRNSVADGFEIRRGFVYVILPKFLADYFSSRGSVFFSPDKKNLTT